MKKASVLFITLLAFKSFAQEQEEKVLEPIIVEEAPLEPPLNYPSAFSTVIDLEDFSGEYKTTSDILSFSPGVVVRDFGGFGQLKTLSIRGSSNDQVVILLDGVRLNSPIGGGVDLSTIPTDYVDRFEIIRGGASALAGSDAIGGVVNIVTKRTDDPFTTSSLTFGSYDTFLANASRAQQIGNLGYFFSYTHAQSEGNFKFKSINNLTLTRINNQFFSENFLGKVNYELNDWKIGFLNESFYDDRGVPGLGEFQQPDANQKDIRNLTSITISKDGFANPDVDFETIVYNNFNQLKFENPDPTIGFPIDTLSNMFTFGINPRLTWLAPFNQIVTVATELRGDVLRDEDFGNPGRFTYSIFLGDEINLFDDMLLLNPIVRLDVYSTYADEDTTDTGFSPKFGAIFSPLDYISIKGNIGRSYRAPSFGELFFPEEGFIGGNPNLKPETSFDFDFGIAFLHPRIGFEVNYFRSKIDDLILFVFVSAQRIEPLNVGKVTEQGIETSLVLRPFDFIELFAGYTFLDGELEDTGAQLPGRPRNKFDFRGVLKNRFLKLFWETHYVDKIPLSLFPNSPTTDARTTHNVGGQIEWWKLYLTVEIDNLFNNLNVQDALDFPLPGRTFFIKAGINF